MMLSSRAERSVCIPCRRIATGVPVCPDCRGPMIHVHHDWRAPRRRNDRAWARVAGGVWMWDTRAVELAAQARAERVNSMRLRRLAARVQP